MFITKGNGSAARMSSLLPSKLVSLFQETDCPCTSLFVLLSVEAPKEVLEFSFAPFQEHCITK